MTVSYLKAKAFLHTENIMQGTAQFMARRILLQEVERTTHRVVHEAAHDVESFIWVLSYCVMRNLYRRASQRSALKEVREQSHAFRLLFRQAFGQTTTTAIANQRHSASYCLNFPRRLDVDQIVVNFMSDTLVALFHDIEGLIHRATDPFNPTPLTHDALLSVVCPRLDSLP
jgi:Fungal protein kinase